MPEAKNVFITIIDNYDSFTYNIVQALQALNCRVAVFRNDAVRPDKISRLSPDAVIISPGPMSPKESGVSMDVLGELEDKFPILGVCLGFQCLLVHYGVSVAPLDEIVHGKTSLVYHDHDPLFEGLNSPFTAARYHSLGTRETPRAFRKIAWTDSGILMAARHSDKPLVGVQFHPESFLTPDGIRVFTNFLKHYV